MKVLVVGANGQIGNKVVKKLADHNHQVLAMVRKEEQRSNVEGKNVKAVVADLEGDLSPAFNEKLDAVIFAAGSGAGTGVDKTEAIDNRGAKKTIDEAVKHNVRRYLIVSSIGTDNPESGPEELRPYLLAKSSADQHLVQSGLDYTIVRPGMLKNDSGTGSVQAAEKLKDYSDSSISRTDVATALVEILDKPNTHQKVIELINGKTPIPDAIGNI
ncbi:SDR family oxidoreductase [Owenweeksia hongkongensis]|uniref:SDR family oxidoreductase n=1 Tax=Owenweeksia hongkongensis TaxID=253245 RepID=UPI003A8F02A0